MKEIHERLARVGLAVTEQYGFVLAGGYALSANGFGTRPSMDVDLFTNDLSPDNFTRAVDDLAEAYKHEGLTVSQLRRRPVFAELEVSDPMTGERSEIQLGYDYREFPPARVGIGPVLDQRDAVANKMTALFSRGEVRDFIDIDLVIESGAYTRRDILALADQREALPLDRTVLLERFNWLQQTTAADFAPYGVDPQTRTAIVDRFSQWSSEIDPVSPDALSQALARLTDATQSLDTMPPDPELTRDELTRDNDR